MVRLVVVLPNVRVDITLVVVVVDSVVVVIVVIVVGGGGGVVVVSLVIVLIVFSVVSLGVVATENHWVYSPAVSYTYCSIAFSVDATSTCPAITVI